MAATETAAPAKKTASEKKLGKPLYRILKVLSKTPKGLTRNQISDKAPVDLAFLSTYIGAHDAAVRKANEEKRGVKGLITLGMVKGEQQEDGSVIYTITDKGRAEAKNAPK